MLTRFIPIFILFASFFIVNTLCAQEENQLLDTFGRDKIPVLIEPMQFPGDLPPSLVERIQQIAYLSVERHWHFQVINHSEQENTGEVDPEYIFQLNLEPLVDELSQRDVRDSLGVLTHTNFSIASGLSFNLRITNIVTGELKYTREVKSVQRASGRKHYRARNFVFNYGSNSNTADKKMYPIPSSPEEEASVIQEQKNTLLLKALDDLPNVWNSVLNDIFPVPIHLVSVLEGSKKKPNTIVVDAGTDFGLRMNYPLELFTYNVYEAMGQTFVREEVIGKYYPRKIEEHRSVGKIYGGRKEVGRALERGEQIFCRLIIYPTRR